LRQYLTLIVLIVATSRAIILLLILERFWFNKLSTTLILQFVISSWNARDSWIWVWATWHWWFYLLLQSSYKFISLCVTSSRRLCINNIEHKIKMCIIDFVLINSLPLPVSNRNINKMQALLSNVIEFPIRCILRTSETDFQSRYTNGRRLINSANPEINKIICYQINIDSDLNIWSQQLWVRHECHYEGHWSSTIHQIIVGS